MALKPDVTLSIIKGFKEKEGFVQKLYYNENVYRISKGTNAFKEIMQVGLECIGDIKEEDIAQVLLLAAQSLKSISNKAVLDISNVSLIAEDFYFGKKTVAQEGGGEPESPAPDDPCAEYRGRADLDCFVYTETGPDGSEVKKCGCDNVINFDDIL